MSAVQTPTTTTTLGAHSPDTNTYATMTAATATPEHQHYTFRATPPAPQKTRNYNPSEHFDHLQHIKRALFS